MSNVWEVIKQAEIIDIIQKATGKQLTGLLLERNSYINRVFEIEEQVSKQRFIVKFYRPLRWTKEMIEEEHSLLSLLKEKELNVITPLLFDGKSIFEYSGVLFSIFPKIGGRSLDEFDKDRWLEIGRLIGRIHLISEKNTGSKRIIWDPANATKKHLETIISTKTIPEDFAAGTEKTINQFIETASSKFEGHEKILLHGDVHRANFIYRPNEGIYIIDFDDMCIGLPVQDLWMLLPDSIDKSKNEINWFIEGYETFRKFDTSMLDVIAYLRGMRLIHFAAWCSIQKGEPLFEKTFPAWGNKKYWSELIKDIQSIITVDSEY